MKLFLLGYNLFGYVDSTNPAPATTLSSSDNESATPNSAFATWFQTDQTVVSYLAATLSEPIFSLTIGNNSSRVICKCIHAYFSQASLANATNLQFQLQSLMKGSHSISNYLQHAKFLHDSLAIINESVSNNNLVSFVFKGLGPDYSIFVAAVTNSHYLPDSTCVLAS